MTTAHLNFPTSLVEAKLLATPDGEELPSCSRNVYSNSRSLIPMTRYVTRCSQQVGKNRTSLEYDFTTRVGTTYDVATRVGTSHVSTTRVGTIRVSTTRVCILITSDLRLIETACIPCLYKPVFGTELGKPRSTAFNSQTTLPKLVFTDCWDLANPNTRECNPKRL
jgi:hypothetical protein